MTEPESVLVAIRLISHRLYELEKRVNSMAKGFQDVSGWKDLLESASKQAMERK